MKVLVDQVLGDKPRSGLSRFLPGAGDKVVGSLMARAGL